ncbi:MAG: aspartate/glutamate racemase family protein [Hyphomicrobiales bacterium]|nr:aspartate/glutamate racemase family protein [Hyphomicrobiales bacterium]
MDAMTTARQAADVLPAPRARIGMIIPSVNSMTEPQFNHFAPPGLAVHVARARVAGQWKRPLPEMTEEIAASARLLSDVAPDLIVFHCTDTSMSQGPQGEGRILDIVREASGVPALATSRLVLEALQKLGLRKLVLLSPYQTNQNVIDYLRATGFEVLHDVALKLGPLDFANVTPREWAELARQHDRADADGIFLSCTNTTQIEAISEIERSLGKPVVNSNQAVLWGCVRRLRAPLSPVPPMPALGRLMQHLDA